MSLFFESSDVEIVEQTPERWTVRVAVTEDMLQVTGVLHGGVSAYIAESIASRHASSLMAENQVALGTNLISTHLLSVDLGDTIEATSTPLHVGRKIQEWRIEMRRASDGALFNVSQLSTYAKTIR